MRNKSKTTFSLILSFLVCLSAYSRSSRESDWNRFLEIQDQYYYLDRQQFNEISCAVDVPLITELIIQIRNQFAPLQGQIEVRDNLSSFTLYYSPRHGLRFTEPELEIIIRSNENIRDPNLLKQGIAKVKNGFKMTVDGVKDQLIGIFDSYSYPKREAHENLSVTNNNDHIIVQYFSNGTSITEKYYGDIIESSVKGNNLQMSTQEQYTKTSNNKFILGRVNMAISQPSVSINSDFSIEYQYVGSVLFPKRITSVSEHVFQSISQKANIEINLWNCQIN